LLTHLFAGVVIAGTGDKGDVRPAASGGDGLIRAFSAKRYLILAASNGFARSREGFKVKNVIGIDTAKDDEVTCGFHNHECPIKSATGISGGACHTFLFTLSPQALVGLNR
jgi:hypothetical protein